MTVELTYTPLEEIEQIHATLDATFKSGKTKSVAWRKHQILQMGYLVKDNVTRIKEALLADLGRPAFESDLLEINSCIGDVSATYKGLDSWMKPEKPAFSLTFQPMRRVIYKQPKGVVLIVSPFNYPLWLAIGPALSAIAAGNAIVLKPSEQTPHVSALLAELIPKYMDNDAIRVVNGAVKESSKLFELPWGHLFFTGSGRVGRIVAGAAAKTLTPVTLELGGKCPIIIDSALFTSANRSHLETAARRILWGKLANAGQTCVAPDYIFICDSDAGKEKLFVEALKKAWNEFFPDGTQSKEGTSRLINPAAFNRIQSLLDKSQGQVVIGGEKDAGSNWMGVTVLSGVGLEDSLMTEEIFGPLLPILRVPTVDEAIRYINANDHPLALYVFTQDRKFRDKVFEATQSGAAIANEVVIHVAADGLPFGGVGGSGYGSHTGKYGFDTFTHFRASMDSPSWIDIVMSARYPPYTDSKLKSLTRMLPSLPGARPASTTPPAAGTVTGSATSSAKWFLLLAIGVATVVLTTQKNDKQAELLGWIRKVVFRQ